jgi:hypothetical protein
MDLVYGYIVDGDRLRSFEFHAAAPLAALRGALEFA